MPPFRATLQTRLVLETLLADPPAELYGLQIVDATGLPPGTIYPILARLESAEWVTSRWEDGEHAEGRPRRRYYRLTPDSVEPARALLAASAQRRQAHRRPAVPFPHPPLGGLTR
ncbi:PadR family transcriptional regulator [Catenuloplanes atrovinosus]|uniref:DNA-binding PadR family transcriptional regulator n=1 Tax=Catenuloplanes atrovinosus TaxID=137266 RepID=A0AAE3YMH0_9ACTN|nr:PadR family transcriptional regulator [Catenuloplanes atrovinosus]MDR7275185.1 DNA-binding PadR family transcriptional regulator [Catenuloplanes atrovinosus]